MKESFTSWKEYQLLLEKEAAKSGLSSNGILELLNYAKPIFDSNLPVIYDIQHLAYLTGYRITYIKRVLNNASGFYRNFNIKKRNGKLRNISEPLPGLKNIQYWISENIIRKCEQNNLNNAYTIGKSIKTNAKYHTKQDVVLNIDIENYFQSINLNTISNFFNKIGYTTIVANTLSALCILDNGLPQGAQTSPSLSNLVTTELDLQLFKYCREINCRYSRYSDDITISGNFNISLAIENVRAILESFGFKINKNKITIKRQHQRQMVTGLVVNQRIGIKKVELKKLRLEIYFIKTKGLREHLLWTKNHKHRYLNHLLGKIQFFLFIRPDNMEVLGYKNFVLELFD
ncbi:MAG: reverse transcriptase family protein [Bacteroidota bacterium]